MKDKELIEEMAKELLNACGWRFGRPNDYREIFNDIAEYLAEQGYRKVKDSVVLSREEYELMENELRDKIYQACKLEKQKTAEKIINHFVTEFPMLKTRVIARELAKQFGVETKE